MQVTTVDRVGTLGTDVIERPLRAYVAGPMRSLAAFNFPAFHDAEAHLKSHGYEVFSPARRDEAKGFDPTGLTGNEDLSDLGFDLREALAADLEWITRYADVVVVLPGWEKSKGANAEVAAARALGIPVETLAGDPVPPVAIPVGIPVGGIEVLANGAKQSRLAYLCGEVPHADLAVAKVLAEGAAKYGRRNWHGIPVESNVEHALAHILHWLAGHVTGEDDLEHAATRMMMALDQKVSGRCAGADPAK